jgi:hypothetical protein
LTKIWFTLFFISLISCDQATPGKAAQTDSIPAIDTPKTKEPVSIIQDTSPYDSLRDAKIDTTTLKGKREYLMNRFLIEHTPSAPDYDTLRDLNFDGQKDYIIGFYGLAGSGIKNRVKIYFYNKKQNRYVLSEILTDLPNPTFYIEKKKITGFYIGNGGGDGARLEWIKGKWTITKEFSVSNEGDNTVWEVNYPLLKKKVKIVRPFQMIPPDDILETNIDF